MSSSHEEGFIPQEGILLPEKYKHLTVEKYLQVLLDFLEGCRKLTKVHIVDFMTTHQWQLIPEEWRDVLLLGDSNEEEWADLIVSIATGSNIKEEWPSTLKQFIQDAIDLPLPRHNSSKIDTIDKHILPGMTDKKIHEVERLSPVIKELASRDGISSIIDLGAGQGYLSRSLGFRTNLKVLAVDSSTVQTCGAKRFDEIAIKHVDKSDLNLHHVTDMITHENASTILSKWSDNPDNEKWLLCGLHTCGDLSSMMLRLFLSSSEMNSLVNVGCCYHFLTIDPESDSSGFPMSRSLRESRFLISPPEKMLSCQAPLRWNDQKQETLSAFEHHFFRALLQFIMVEKGLATASHAPVIGRLNKKKDFVNFPIYVKAALKRLKLSPDAITSEEAQAYYDEYKEKQIDKQIAILWTLRVLVGPIFESIILIDRWMYLNENIPDSATKGVWMWPLFDPVASPRNVVIAANK